MYFINDSLERDNVHILKASSYFVFFCLVKNITQAVLFKSIRALGAHFFTYNVKQINMTPPASIITRMR